MTAIILGLGDAFGFLVKIAVTGAIIVGVIAATKKFEERFPTKPDSGPLRIIVFLLLFLGVVVGGIHLVWD